MVGMIKFTSIEEKLNHLQSLKNIPSINPRDYDPESEYHRLDYISHQEFGIGFIEEVVDEMNVKAFFSSGEKVLQQKAFLSKVV